MLSIANGKVTYSAQRQPTTTATYECDDDYELTGGSVTVTCQFDGSWDGVKPTCSKSNSYKVNHALLSNHKKK